MIVCEARGRDGTEPEMKSGHGMCSLTLLAASGPTNWSAVTVNAHDKSLHDATETNPALFLQCSGE